MWERLLSRDASYSEGSGVLLHHLALEVGVVARALPWGPDRGVDGLLHIHFQKLVVVEADDLVAEVLVAVLVAKDVSDLPSREAARHRGQLAGAEGVAVLPGVALEKGEVDGVVAHAPPAWRGGPAEAPVLQGRVAVWGAMGSSLVPSRCLFAHRRVVLFPTNLLLFSQSSAFSRRNVLESQRLFLPLHRQSSPSLFTMLKSCEAFFVYAPLRTDGPTAFAKRHGFLGI